jgi:hypothetical protein
MTEYLSAPLESVWVRVLRDLRCPCGRQIDPHDVETFDDTIRVICASCHDLILEIELLSSSE